MQGFRPSHVRWSVFRRRRGTSPSPTGGGVAAGRLGMGAGHTLGRWLLFRWRLGTSAGGAGFRPSQVRWSVFRRRRGTSPSPTGGGVAAGRLGMGAGHTLGRWLLFRWRLGTSAGGAGFRPSHVRWSVFRRRRGTSPSPTLGRRRCRRRWGWAPALQGSRPPTSVVGVSPAAGDEPQPYIRSAALPPAAGDERRPYRGRRCRRPVGGSAPALQGAALPRAICFRTIVWQFGSSRLM